MKQIIIITGLLLLRTLSRADSKLGFVYWGDVRSSLYSSEVHDDSYVDCGTDSNSGNCRGGLAQLQGHIEQVQKGFFNGIEPNRTLRFMTGNFLGGETGYLGCSDTGLEDAAGMLDGTFFSTSTSNTTYYAPDYMSLGMADFESGLSVLGARYLNHTLTKTVVTNVDCTYSSKCNDFVKNQISSIEWLKYEDVTIGLVGFVNPLANNLSLTGEAVIQSPDLAIAKTIASPGAADFYIAIGSGSFKIAQEIIDRNPQVKLVIYGGGTKTLTDGIEPYKTGWIATTGSKYGHYLGALKLTIKDKKLTGIEGKKIEVTGDYAPAGIIKLLEKFVEDTNCRSVLPGSPTAAFRIDGSNCWTSECNLGNLVTDAMVHCAYNTSFVEGEPIISVWHGGSMFKDVVNANVPIKEIDIHRWLPYHNNAWLVQMSGKALWRLFELSGTGLAQSPNWGQFLQVSDGVQAFYEGTNIVGLRTLHSTDGIPKFDKVANDEDHFYLVVIPSMMHFKKSVWRSLEFKKTVGSVGFDDVCLRSYILGQGKITHGFEERIFFDDEEFSLRKCSKKTGLTIFLTLLVTGLIVGIFFAFYRFVVVPRRANNNWFW